MRYTCCRHCLLAITLLLTQAGVAESIIPFSLFGNSDGISSNAAETQDVAASLQDAIEYDRLIDAEGVTACDRYFGWGGHPRIETEAQKILCGKYQFFYEHWSTVGMPRNMLEFNAKWFNQLFGHEFENLGYFPDDNPKRIVTDIRPVAGGQCMATERQCGWEWWGLGFIWRCHDVCTRQAPEDTWQEIYELVSDDKLPIGFQISPKKTFGFEAASFTCAGCHMGRLPDGRYAVGMANQNLNYGMLLTGSIQPMQASLASVMQILEDPAVSSAYEALLEGLAGQGGLSDLLDVVDTMKMHPAMMFNDPSTEFAPILDQETVAANTDMKVGSCYYRPNGELIRCDHNHPDKGPQSGRDKAATMLGYLNDLIGPGVTRRNWVMDMKEVYGDTYCVPWPYEPDDLGGVNNTAWGQFYIHALPGSTLDSMARNCDGLRWNVDYWIDFFQTMVGMLNADFANLAFPTMSEQDMFINGEFNVLDFLEAPMTDDQVWTFSKIANVVGISGSSVLEAHANMRTAGGLPNNMLAMSGAGRDLEHFISAFVILSGGVDPRYVQCDDPDIVGNWNATPNDTCSVIAESIEPLRAYIESLKTPFASGSVTAEVTRGQALFDTECAGCHEGPAGETSGVFMFAQNIEGLEAVPLCAPGQNPVEWTSDIPPRPTFNHCRPTYTDVPPGVAPEDDIAAIRGFIATDPTYSQFAQPDPLGGKAGINPELSPLGKFSQGVKGQRLTGVRYKAELFHHGQSKNLDDVLCRAGSRRADTAQRETTVCMVYDLNSQTGLAAYKAGNGVCLQEWQPYKGHEFGCSLVDTDKQDLIQYLRTL